MNWYFEKDGISQGPLSEAALAAKVRAKEVPADSLIWHVGREDWQSVNELRPAWLEPPAPALAPTAAKPMPPAAKTEKTGLLQRLFSFGKSK